MATESQFDGWRKNVLGNLRKAGEAFTETAHQEIDPEAEMHPSDRAKLCLAFAQATGQIMVAERIAQVTQALYADDETMQAANERVRTGEQIIQRMVDLFGDVESLDEGQTVVLTMAEDWLDPEGLVKFSTPEAVEAGQDPHSNLEPEPIEVDPPEAELFKHPSVES